MAEQSKSKTVLWVPRFWPAVGGTEFHSHELARNLAQHHSVCVLNHCTSTESLSVGLPELAATATASDRYADGVHSVTLAPTENFKSALSFLGENYERSVMVRKAYQHYFNQAFRESASTLLQDAQRIHFIYNGLTDAAYLASIIAEHYNIPFVFTPNVLDTSASGSAWSARSFHALYESASQLIALTDHEAAWLVDQGVNANKISVVPYGPILQARVPEQEVGEVSEVLNSQYILFLARLVPEKGYKSLIRAFELLATRDEETQLVLAGPVEEPVDALIDAVNQRLGKKRVRLMENVSQPVKTALIEEAALLCIPSRKESFGGAYIEAMACATPVVALNRPVSRCVIDHGVNGLLVENNTESLVAALRQLLRDPAGAEAMGIAGKYKVSEHYAWPAVAEQILKVYERASAAHAAASLKAA